jgi:hypothetical protein
VALPVRAVQDEGVQDEDTTCPKITRSCRPLLSSYFYLTRGACHMMAELCLICGVQAFHRSAGTVMYNQCTTSLREQGMLWPNLDRKAMINESRDNKHPIHRMTNPNLHFSIFLSFFEILQIFLD